MTQLLKTRSTKGHLIIYEDRVSLENSMLGVKNENSLPFSQITGCEIKTTMAEIPILSKGAATVKIFSIGNQKIEAPFVIVKDAKKAKELIDARIGKGIPSEANTNVNDLEKLSDLKDKGIITQEEFDKKKKQILGI